MNKNAIVWTVSDSYLPNVFLQYSLYKATINTNDADFYLLTTKLNSTNIKKLQQICSNLHVIFVDELLQQFFGQSFTRGWGIFCYSRLFILHLPEFNDYQSILYLDSDAVIQRNIDNNIWKINDSITEMISLVAEVHAPRLSDLNAQCINNNLTYNGQKYGNSGVILFNMNNILGLKDKIFLDIVKLSQQYNWRFCDQDIINYYFDRIHWMHPKFNQFWATTTNKISKNTVIWHNCGMSRQARLLSFFNMIKNDNKFIDILTQN